MSKINLVSRIAKQKSKEQDNTNKEPKTSIRSIIKAYFDYKQEEKMLKEHLNSNGKLIKSFMLDNAQTEYISDDGIRITYKPTEKTTMNQEKLLETIKSLIKKTKDKETKDKIKSCIKKVEVVDEYVLEELIYNDIISDDSLSDCVETTTTYTLRCNKVKKD